MMVSSVFMDLLLEDAHNKQGIRLLILHFNYSSIPIRMSHSETQLYLQTIAVKMVWKLTWVSELILGCVIQGWSGNSSFRYSC
jgi:hypothetical protein